MGTTAKMTLAGALIGAALAQSASTAKAQYGYGGGWQTWNGCPPGYTVQGGWRTWNGCPPGYTVQGGFVSPIAATKSSHFAPL